MRIIPAIVLLLSFTHMRVESAPPVGVEVPIAFRADNLLKAGTNDIILPVYPVGLLVTDETAQKAGANSVDVVDRTCELLRAIHKKDIEAFSNLTVTAEGQGITDPEMFFSYLQGLYYPKNGQPVIVAYSKDKSNYCVWLTTTKRPEQLYAMILEGPDLKWNLMTQGGQFNVVHDYLNGEDLAAAIKDGGVPLPPTDGIFDLKSQLPLESQKADGLAPLIDRIKSQTKELTTKIHKSADANDPSAKLLADALSALSQVEAACSIGGITAVIGKAQNGETSLFYFEKVGDTFKPILTQNYGPLGTFLLESYQASKESQQVSAGNRAN